MDGCLAILGPLVPDNQALADLIAGKLPVSSHRPV
jgi:hypothetical protein